MSVLTQIKEAPAANPIERLLVATEADMARVNTLILSRADSHVEMVPELARYLIESGGWLLRGLFRGEWLYRPGEAESERSAEAF